MSEEQERLLARFALRYLMSKLGIDDTVAEFMEIELGVMRFDDQLNAMSSLRIKLQK